MDRTEPIDELLSSYPHKPFGWALSEGSQSLVEYLRSQLAHDIESGGMVKTYYLGGKVVGLCATCPDTWASQELRRRAYRVTQLMAMGKTEAQLLIKTLLLNEALRDLRGACCLVANVPYSDLTSINALERTGFVATQTSLVLARDLENAEADTTADAGYEVATVGEDDFDRLLRQAAMEIPDGFLGWDSGLPQGTVTRIHNDWLRSYAHEKNLRVASDHGRPVGLLAERVRTDTTPTLGFSVGAIDLVATVPEYRNNGVAGHLVMDTLRSFKADGVRLAEMKVHSAITPTAAGLGVSGFAPVGTTVTMTNWRH
ncbi:MAG: GNAT family N-acetyltransferase [candidate division WOR-3 bacterium]